MAPGCPVVPGLSALQGTPTPPPPTQSAKEGAVGLVRHKVRRKTRTFSECHYRGITVSQRNYKVLCLNGSMNDVLQCMDALPLQFA